MSQLQLRILFIAPAPRAGTAQYTHNLACALAQRGHRVAFATGVGYELGAYASDYTVIEVFDGFKLRPLRLLKFIVFLLRFTPDIVHLQGGQHPTSYLALYAAIWPLTRARFVYSPQDTLINSSRPRDISAFRLLFARMSHVFVNARQNIDPLSQHFGVPPDRISVLPIADLLAFLREGGQVRAEHLPMEPKDKVILCFGLIEPRKGIATLLESFPRILAAVPDARLLIVGKPLMPLEPMYARAAELGIAERCTWITEYVSFEKMAGVFQRSDVVTLPYEVGWNSGVLSAALGFGKPVVATRVGGLAEAVEEELTGLLVPPKDPDALAAAITRLLQDTALQARIAAHLPVAARRNTWEFTAAETERKYFAVVPAASS